MDSRSRSPCPGGSGGTARMEGRAGERPRACPHRGDRAAAGPSAAKSSISGVMHRRRFFRSPGRRRDRPCSAAGAVIRGGGRCAFDVPALREGDRGVSRGGDRASTVWERSRVKWFYEMQNFIKLYNLDSIRKGPAGRFAILHAFYTDRSVTGQARWDT